MISSSSLLLLLLGASLSFADLKVYNLYATDVAPSGDTPDAYVKVFLGSMSLGQTVFVKDNKNPVWSEQFHFVGAQEHTELRMEVIDKDVTYDDHLGTCRNEIRVGTYREICSLNRGGTLHFTYTLSQ